MKRTFFTVVADADPGFRVPIGLFSRLASDVTGAFGFKAVGSVVSAVLSVAVPLASGASSTGISDSLLLEATESTDNSLSGSSVDIANRS